MKNLTYTTLIMLAILAARPLSAKAHWSHHPTPPPPHTCPQPSTKLPIDSQLWWLTAAGLTIGILTLKKFRREGAANS